MARWTALKETDLAAIARAKDAVQRLHAIQLRLCFHRPTDEMMEQMREAIQDISVGLEMATLWVAQSKKEVPRNDTAIEPVG